MAVNVLVLRAAGINCDEETMHCWRLAGAAPVLMHINELAASPDILDDFQLVTLPGGFSFGDDIAAGQIMARRLEYDVFEPLQRLVHRGGGILGICNGFQVLMRLGLLPGGSFGRGAVTVTYNDSAKFEARWVRLEVSNEYCPFLTPSRAAGSSPREHPTRAAGFSPREHADTAHPSNNEHSPAHQPTAPANVRTDPQDGRRRLELAVEHGEGKVVTVDDATARRLEEAGHIALRYVDEHGRFDTYPANPNGSILGIAGLCDPTGRIFGLMPHPDRHFAPTHHPTWTRDRSPAPPDGLAIFQNAVAHWSTARE